MKRLWITLTCIGLTSAVWAAAPPEYINYQGVLRDALNNPLDGDHDMVFRLYDAQTLGNLLLTDSHTSTDPPPVEPVNVTGGLFNAHLGEGHPTAGVYNTLAEVFASEGGVWLEIQVGNEVLSPRVRVIAAAYALNADHLDGRDSTGFLDTSSSTQYKTGTVIFDASSQPNLGVEATGQAAGGYFSDSDENGSAYVGYGSTGIWAQGDNAGGYFYNSAAGSEAEVASSLYGISAEVTRAGGYFKDTNGTGYALVGFANSGIHAYGRTIGGYFRDSNSSGYVYAGYGDTGIEAHGDIGIEAIGAQAGGSFNTVGIGTSSPSVELEVVGDAVVSGMIESTSGGIRFPDGSVQTSAVSSLPPDECFDNVGRYAVCGDGTVKDNLTGLFWLENANCFDNTDWADASIRAAQLADGQCGLTDGSSPGDWRLPTKDEWQVIVDQAVANGCVDPGPYVPNTVGTGCWSEGDPFSGVQSDVYWSATTSFASSPFDAWSAYLGVGDVFVNFKTLGNWVWPVRGGP